MTWFYVDDLSEGMILASDLLTPTGRFILAAGSMLNTNHLKVLKSWGILKVDIVDDSCLASEPQEITLDPVYLELAEIFLQEKFANLDPEHELVKSLYQQSLHLLCQRLSAGAELPIRPPVSTLPDPDEGRINPLHLIRGETQLTSLPEVYVRILETINAPRTSSATLAEIVSKDPNLALRLLRLVNSAFYGFPGKVDSISRGITLIGTDELSMLALGLSVVKLFQDIPTELMDMESFWKHSIRVGLFAQVIASQKDGLSPERLFVGGMLHDVGRLVLLKKIPEKYARAMLLAQEKKLSLCQAEKDYLRCDHASVGRVLAQEWSLPKTLGQMIGGHHNPAMDRFVLEACIVHLADVLAHACGDELLQIDQIPPLQEKAWKTIDLLPVFLPSAIHLVEHKFQDIVRFFTGSSLD